MVTNLTATNLSVPSGSVSGESAAVLGFKEGYAKGFEAAAAHVDVLVFFLLFSYLVQLVLVWAGRRIDLAPKWEEKVLPTYRLAAFWIRIGICVALVTRTYAIL